MKKLLLILLLTILPSCSLSIDNTRDVQYIVTGLEVLGLEGVHVRVIQYPKVPGNFFMGYKYGQTEKEDGYGANHYTISIYGRLLSKNHFWNILAHELIHVKQLHTGEINYFKHKEDMYFVWKGDTVKANDIKYDDRPWETEAFAKADSVKTLIENELKRKKFEGNKKRFKRFQKNVKKHIGLD
jgi:hypothetical protein